MTVAPPTLVNLQSKLVANLHTTNLGIVGDAAHIRSGGYHIGAQSLRNAGMGNDYSLQYALDKNANHDYACAIDIGGTPELLMTLGTRLVHALKNKDARIYGKIRGTNAPYDGQSIDRRYDTQDPSTSADDHTETSDDRNHIHVEVYRTLVLNQSVMDGLYDVLAGSDGTTNEEDDMPLTAQELTTITGDGRVSTQRVGDAVHAEADATRKALLGAQGIDNTRLGDVLHANTDGLSKMLATLTAQVGALTALIQTAGGLDEARAAEIALEAAKKAVDGITVTVSGPALPN